MAALLIYRGAAQNNAAAEFNLHYNRAMAYDKLYVFGPCIEELNKAIDYASLHNLEYERVNATITLAEILRKTHDYDKGINLLLKLERSTAYPKLHVRKLGRMAAIYSEWTHSRDSILHYLDSALALASSMHLKAEAASLYNELGYTLSGVNRQLGLFNLRRSAALFKEMKDTANYISPMINMLRSYLVLKDKPHAEAVIRELMPLLNNRNSYTSQIEFYNLMANYQLCFFNDSAGAAHWKAMACKSTIGYLESINTSQLNAFRTVYGTKQLQDRITEKEQELAQQRKRTRELIIFLSLMGFLILCVIALFIREHRLRERLKTSNNLLQVSNNKYQMLITESNHRIKNNLQMVISMLQYSDAGQNPVTLEAFKRMSGKIQVISTLHKHLTADIHNELVSMDVYFNEIISLYREMMQKVPEITVEVAPVKIRSERIVYFGLILNEMVTNTIAHANTRDRKIKILVKAFSQGYSFSYCDGSPHSGHASGGTGSGLIIQLIERVGGFAFNFDETSGDYQFRFYE